MYTPGPTFWLFCLMITTHTYAIPQSYSTTFRPHYIDCVNDNECARNECCVIGRGRYTIPTCRWRLDMGEQCRPNDEPISVNLTYPEGTRVELRDVHYTLCPCQSGLKCSSKTGLCMDSSIPEYFNDLGDMYY